MCYDGVKSPFLEVLAGIPQGSTLGPTLFNIYINGIFELPLNGRIQLFADDAALVYGEKEFTTIRAPRFRDSLLLVFNDEFILKLNQD